MSEPRLAVCETTAAITTHLRVVTDRHPIRLSGHSDRPLSLCGMTIAWDTRRPVSVVGCRECLAVHDGVTRTEGRLIPGQTGVLLVDDPYEAKPDDDARAAALWYEKRLDGKDED